MILITNRINVREDKRKFNRLREELREKRGGIWSSLVEKIDIER